MNASVQMHGETTEISGIQGQEKGLNQRLAPPVKWTKKKKKKVPAKKSRNDHKGLRSLDQDVSSKKHTLNEREVTELAGTDNSLTPKGEEIHQINLQLESQYQTTQRLNAKLQVIDSTGSPRTQRLSMANSRDPSNKELGGGFTSRLPSPKEVTLSPRSNEPKN